MGKRKMYNTTLDVDLLREIKILAAQLDLRQNDLIEEAIQDLLKKYKYQEPSKDVSNSWADRQGAKLKFIMLDILVISAITLAVVANVFVFCTAFYFLSK